MTEQELKVLNLVKVRLGLQNEAHTPLIETYVHEMEWRIKNYCNISSLPEGLLFTWASMVMDAVRVELSSIDEIADTADQAVNIKIGDTSTSPAQQSGISNMSKSVIDSVVLNYRVDLNRYRRMRW